MTTTEYHSACRQRCFERVSTSASRFLTAALAFAFSIIPAGVLASGDAQSNRASVPLSSPMDGLVLELMASHDPTPMDQLVASLSRTSVAITEPVSGFSSPTQLYPSQDVLASRIAQKYRIAPEKASRIVSLVHEESQEKGVDPILVLSIIATESSFNPRARSSVGALGLMQAMPRYHQEKLDRLGLTANDLYNPRPNIKVGTEILSEYLDLSGGNTTSALQRYNGSLSDKSRRYSNKVFRAMAWLSGP